MNARANVAKTDPARMLDATARAEHISIEAEDANEPAPKPNLGKVLCAYVLASPLRGYRTELAILDNYFISVRAARPDAGHVQYVVDLRFANPRPVRVRHIAWGWLLLTTLIAAGAAFAFWRASTAPEFWTGFSAYRGCAALAIAGTAFIGFLRGTTEALVFTSRHGAAPLVRVIGGIGSARAGKSFFIALIKAINAAKLARSQPKAQWLRDEMREHHRLRELGALSQAEYEASKAQILGEHG
jgi:hypothetical protein